jgi:antitoxin (DNA-binding transcriptional repressor) of toxin-antitoxin stability system
MDTTKVGIREFRSGLAEYIASETPVTITRHGQTVGFFIPAHGKVEANVAVLKAAGAKVDRLLAERSMDVDQLAGEFDTMRKVGSAANRAARK